MSPLKTTKILFFVEFQDLDLWVIEHGESSGKRIRLELVKTREKSARTVSEFLDGAYCIHHRINSHNLTGSALKSSSVLATPLSMSHTRIQPSMAAVHILVPHVDTAPQRIPLLCDRHTTEYLQRLWVIYHEYDYEVTL